MQFELQPWTPAHSPGIATVAAAVAPYFVNTPDVVTWSVESTPAAAQSMTRVAVAGSQVLGYVQAQLDWESASATTAEIDIAVDPGHRGHGVGGRLLRAGEDHLRALGVRTVELWATDTESVTWFERRGYVRRRASTQAWLDLADLPPIPDPPAGVELLPFTHFGADSRTIWELDLATSVDEPGMESAQFGYEEWRHRRKDHPALDPELSLVAVCDGVPAGFTTVFVDGPRYRSGLTGVLREFRGRGLAFYVKAVSLHAARSRGLREATTGNDTTNAPMLAVNRRLGYRPRWAETSLERHFAS